MYLSQAHLASQRHLYGIASCLFLLFACVGLTLIPGQYSLPLAEITIFLVIGALIGSLLPLKGADRALEEHHAHCEYYSWPC
jgi:hypothetical protein